MFPLRLRWLPQAKKENITTERNTEGDKPEITAKIPKAAKIAVSLIKEPFLLFGIGFKIKETVDVNIGNGFFMNDYVMEKIIDL